LKRDLEEYGLGWYGSGPDRPFCERKTPLRATLLDSVDWLFLRHGMSTLPQYCWNWD